MKSILNELTNYKGFVFEKIEKNHDFDGKLESIYVKVVPRKNSQGECPICGRRCSTYDTSQMWRKYEFIPIWMIPVFFLYRLRRVSCPEHGVVTERVPWSSGKSSLTREYSLFLANWARRLSWSEVASCFQTTYGKVYRAIAWVVEYGLKQRSLDGVESIGVDEVQYRHGHEYITLVYQIDGYFKRLLYIGRGRTERTLAGFFSMFDRGTMGSSRRSMQIKWICSDMWKPYLNVIKTFCRNGLNILDRFHIKEHLNKAVDETRKADVAQLNASGREAVLVKSKWLFLKNWLNLSAKQVPRLRELLQYNLRVVRAYLMKEDFDHFWDYKSRYWAQRYLHSWCMRAMRSRIEPMKRFVSLIRSHEELIMNWFDSKGLSSGVVEGLNNKVKLTVRKSYGFGSYKSLEMALYHTLGKLPEPEVTHRFW
ncbi:MAG: ISL3 family transposase [Fibrobacter sp.]|nr:ISL3 family transposase [Fibrobacter sp.]